MLLAALLGSGFQTAAPTCPAPGHIQTLHSLKALPTPVRSALLVEVRDIVDSHEVFDNTDVVRHGAHFNRFAFAWHADHRFVIATEHGGIAYSTPVYIYAWDGGANLPRLVGKTVGHAADLCAVAATALKDTPPPARRSTVSQ